MNKQEVIKKAWGVHFSSDVDENGFRTSNVGSIGWDSKCFDITEVGSFEYLIRPKSLQGIEKNNGWIKIESEADLPNDTEDNLIYNFITTTGKMIIGYYNRRVNFICKYGTEQGIFGITHYQPITKPLKPIY